MCLTHIKSIENFYVMKTFPLFLLFFAITITAAGQSLIGNWQMVKQSNCLDNEMSAATESSQELVEEMKSRSSATPVVVKFKDKSSGEESVRVLTKRKAANNKNFLYKFDGETLLILDKKSRTITDSFLVEKVDADSLILSNVSRPCETRIFLKIK